MACAGAPSGASRHSEVVEAGSDNARNRQVLLHATEQLPFIHSFIHSFIPSLFFPLVLVMRRRVEDGTKALIKSDGLKRGWAFPTGLSLNHCAAHYSPNYGDKIVLQKSDVLKVSAAQHPSHQSIAPPANRHLKCVLRLCCALVIG
jgi:hypothetical protein